MAAILTLLWGVVATGPATAAGTGAVRLVSRTSASQTAAANAVSVVRQTPLAWLGGFADPRATSADGTLVAFMSSATNVVAGQSDANTTDDVFLWNRATGAVTLVSHTAGSATTTLPMGGTNAVISGDGAYVAFQASAGCCTFRNVFLYQPSTGAVTLVSHAAAGTDSSDPSISADGSFVTFTSAASDLVAGQVDGNPSDVFVYQRSTGTIALVSHTPGSAVTTANHTSVFPVISADGAFVAFSSSATNLVTGQVDAAGTLDLFLYQRSTGAVSLISHTPAGAATTPNVPAGESYISTAPSITSDAAFVAFYSQAPNLVAGQTDTNNAQDVFLYQRSTGAVTLVSRTPASATAAANGSSESPSISADGAFVAFASDATNLVTGQTDPFGTPLYDVFLYTRATGAMTLVSHTPASATTAANTGAQDPQLSANGAYLAFISGSTDLVAGQTDIAGTPDVFLFQRASGTNTLVSHKPASLTTAGGGDSPSISADGGLVAFDSVANNLVAGQTDTNSATDVFSYQRLPDSTAVADFDGDRDTDVSVFRLSTGTWFVLGGSPAAVVSGASGDIPVPGDYDGDGNVDEAVFRPSDNNWYLRTGTPQSIPWGAAGDIPVPGDYDGNGTTDIGVFRPSSGVWFLRLPSPQSIPWGSASDIPVPGDYDGNGTVDLAVFRPSTNVWYLRTATPSSPVWGASGDIPVPGDYDGDGVTDVAVFRPAGGTWFLRTTSPQAVTWGASADVPSPGDYNGDRITDLAVFRPSTNVWYVRTPSPSSPFWGASGDIPLPLPQAIRRAFF